MTGVPTDARIDRCPRCGAWRWRRKCKTHGKKTKGKG